MIKKLLLLNMSKVHCFDKLIIVKIKTERKLQSDIYMKKFTNKNLRKENLQSEMYKQKFTNRNLKIKIYMC